MSTVFEPMEMLGVPWNQALWYYWPRTTTLTSSNTSWKTGQDFLMTVKYLDRSYKKEWCVKNTYFP